MAISSRRQYTQVSNAIRKHYPTNPSNPNYQHDKAEWDKFIDTLIKDYSEDNPAFDAVRFRRECVNGHER